MMRKNSLMRFCQVVGVSLFLLSVFVFLGAAEASVTLSPRYISGGSPEIDGTREDYVLFGKFDHRLNTYNDLKLRTSKMHLAP